MNLSLATEWSFQGDSLYVHAPGAIKHPFICRSIPASSGIGWPHHTDSLSPQLALRLTTAAQRRYLSPTFATDTRYEHPQTVRFPSAQLSLDYPLAAPNLIQCCNAAPDRLAAFRPRVDTRLTTWPNFGQITHTPASREGPSTAPGDATLPRCYQPRARLCDSTSDAPSHAPSRISNPNLAKP